MSTCLNDTEPVATQSQVNEQSRPSNYKNKPTSVQCDSAGVCAHTRVYLLLAMWQTGASHYTELKMPVNYLPISSGGEYGIPFYLLHYMR